MPVPTNAAEDSSHRLPEFIANEQNEGRVRWRWRFDPSETFQTMMKDYYRLVTEVDATCGRVLDELKAQGELDHTLVIFIGDNGCFHAEHGLADKWYPHQECIRVPLIVRDPRMAGGKHGSTNDGKYFYRPDFKRERLFDVRSDPHEEHDLMNDPAQKERLAERRHRFAELNAAAR